MTVEETKTLGSPVASPASRDIGRQRQSHIYLEGLAGTRPPVPIDTRIVMTWNLRRAIAPIRLVFLSEAYLSAGRRGASSTVIHSSRFLLY